jgi:hypothetical protein
MGEREDRLREQIKAKFGSVPKMASATGIPRNTIYHALERGLLNTRTETLEMIMDALMENEELENANITPDEKTLVEIYRSLDDRGRRVLMSTARALAE